LTLAQKGMKICCNSLLTGHEAQTRVKWWLSQEKLDSFAAEAFLLGCPVAFLVWLYIKWHALGAFTQIYSIGVISYWLWWIFGVLMNCIRLLSTYDRNLAQIGMRRNLFVGVMEDRRYLSSGLLAALGVLVFSLLSWFVYFLEAYRFIKRLLYRWRRPKAIKEIEWIVKHHLLSPLDVGRFDVKTQQEIALGRKLTEKECQNWQQQLDDRGIDVKMTEVLALNDQNLSPPK
jgi:hypothetical protein